MWRPPKARDEEQTELSSTCQAFLSPTFFFDTKVNESLRVARKPRPNLIPLTHHLTQFRKEEIE